MTDEPQSKTRRVEVEHPFDFTIEDGDLPDPPAVMHKWLKAALEQMLVTLADGHWMTGIDDVAAMRWSVPGFDGDALALGPADFIKTVTKHLEAEAGVFVHFVTERSRQQAADDWQEIRTAWLDAIEQIDAEAAKIAALPDLKGKSP